MVGVSRAAIERAAKIAEPSADINSIEILICGWLVPCLRTISKIRICIHASHSWQGDFPVVSIP